MISGPESPSLLADARLDLPSRLTIVLVADLVESVRWMQLDEQGVIHRWQSFMDGLLGEILPAHGGKLVKNLGDGVMVEFASAVRAVHAAAAMHHWMAHRGKPLTNDERLALRVGLHAAKVYEGRNDLYGIGVNLAARIATLAEAGETVATAQLRDLISDVLDADVEDLGDCHLRHLDRPVRVYRLGAAQTVRSVPAQRSYSTPLKATLAVIPFANLLSPTEFWGIGDLLADGIIGGLSLSAGLQVVSRLSSSVFRSRTTSLDEIANRLDVRYIVSGNYAVSGSQVTITAELADVVSGHILWSQRLRGKWRDLLEPASELIHEIVDQIHQKLLESTATKASTRPLPALNSYELFLGGISLMHRFSSDDFEMSRRLFESLADRHRRIASPHAWLAKWQVLRVIQGATTDIPAAAELALEHTRRALDLEPTSALALAIEGFVYAHLKKDLDTAETRLQTACNLNPSEGFAWLFRAVTHAFRGESVRALEAAHRALKLSPMDPLRYFYESLMGSCEFSAGHFDEAIRWSETSRRRNRQHLSTLRILIAAYVAIGKDDQASSGAEELVSLWPHYRVAAYEANSVAVLYPFGQQIAKAMRQAGIP